MIWLLTRKIIQSLALISFLWLSGFAFFAVTTLLIKPDAAENPVDAIVVPTGDEQRIETGLSLLAQKRSGHLFISGVYKDVTEQEVRAMWASAEPLPECCIALGRMAQSTEQNGRETAAWLKDMKFDTILLVTSGYHMHRAAMELMHASPGLRIHRHPVGASDTGDNRFWQLLFVEYNKTLFRAAELLSTVLRRPQS